MYLHCYNALLKISRFQPCPILFWYNFGDKLREKIHVLSRATKMKTTDHVRIWYDPAAQSNEVMPLQLHTHINLKYRGYEVSFDKQEANLL